MNQSDRPRLRALALWTGILTLIAGVLFLAVPPASKFGGEWIIATLLIVGALTSAGFALTALRWDVKVFTSLMAALSLATGIIVLVHPLDTFITLTTLMGFYFMLESGLMGGLGMSMRPHWQAVGVLLAFALISFIMSALIWLKLAGAPKGVIVDLLGVSFAARGLVYIILSVLMKGRSPLPRSPIAPISNEGLPN